LASKGSARWNSGFRKEVPVEQSEPTTQPRADA